MSRIHREIDELLQDFAVVDKSALRPDWVNQMIDLNGTIQIPILDELLDGDDRDV